MEMFAELLLINADINECIAIKSTVTSKKVSLQWINCYSANQMISCTNEKINE